MKNFYTILEVTPDSSDEEIKANYRKLARMFHPDINPQGGEFFKNITEAYETLSNPQKRLQYDTINGFFKTNKQKNFDANNTKKEYKKSENIKQKSKYHTNFSDLFKKKKEKPTPENGKDIYEELVINSKDVLEGSQRTVNIMHTHVCTNCKGRKFINGTKCSVCNGAGEMFEHKKISVKIPRNVKNNIKLRIKGEGNPGKNGGKNGDLYLKIIIDSNTNFNGNNNVYKVPISPFEAVLGATIKINVTGENISLKIPPRTNSGQKFRLQGVKDKDDLIVIVNIEIPSSLSDDEIKLYEKLKKVSGNIRENL